jgi:hypothetical protein
VPRSSGRRVGSNCQPLLPSISILAPTMQKELVVTFVTTYMAQRPFVIPTVPFVTPPNEATIGGGPGVGAFLMRYDSTTISIAAAPHPTSFFLVNVTASELPNSVISRECVHGLVHD